jgi:hypothetical protein
MHFRCHSFQAGKFLVFSTAVNIFLKIPCQRLSDALSAFGTGLARIKSERSGPSFRLPSNAGAGTLSRHA